MNYCDLFKIICQAHTQHRNGKVMVAMQTAVVQLINYIMQADIQT